MSSNNVDATMLSTYLPCSANYATACSRETSRQHAIHVARLLEEADAKGVPPEIYMTELNHGVHNLNIGFFPFVFDDRGYCVAHGAKPILVGKHIDWIVSNFNLYMNSTDWIERFTAGGFVSYLFRLDKQAVIDDKTAYVVPILGNTRFVAVGWINRKLPTDPFCSATSDSFCSFRNVQSIVGWGQTRLSKATSRDSFESALRDLSEQQDFRVVVEGDKRGNLDDFSLVVFDNQGQVLVNQIPDAITSNVTDLFASKGYNESVALDFFERLQSSVETKDSGWFRYSTNKSADLSQEKVVHSVKILYGGAEYFLGAEFDLRLGDVPEIRRGELCSSTTNHPCAFQNARTLLSHTIAHLITAEDSLEDRFRAITESDSFRPNGFYAFFYDVPNSICVAHGGNTLFVNRTLHEVFDLAGIRKLDASQLLLQWKDTALRGAGWSAYDWVYLESGTVVKVPNRLHQKISLIALVELDGRQFIGGVGFDNKQTDFGHCLATKKTKACSEEISLSLLGEALSNLILASSEASATTHFTNISFDNVEDVYDAINRKQSPFVFSDFAVTIVSYGNSTVCTNNDGTGCIIASSSADFNQGMTWKEALEYHGAELSGEALHKNLILQSSKPNGNTRVAWTTGNRKFWTARYDHDGKYYYALVHYDEIHGTTRNGWWVAPVTSVGSVLSLSAAMIVFLWCRGRCRRKTFTSTSLKGVVSSCFEPKITRIPREVTPAASPRLFLCHRGPDSKEAIVRPTYHFLVHTLGLPVESVFFDNALKSGGNKEKVSAIEREAAKCTLAVVVLSKTFRDSPYAVGELNLFEQRLKDDDNIVIQPILWRVSNEDLSGYSKQIRQLIHVGSKELQSAPDFLRENMLPALVEGLGRDREEFDDECIVKALCNYIENRRGVAELPFEFEAFYRTQIASSSRRQSQLSLTEDMLGYCHC